MLELFKRLFSTADQPVANEPSIEYKGYLITPSPRKVEGGFGVNAMITMGSGSEIKTHRFIRADSMGSRDACIEVTINKAKMTIDQMGDRIFK